MTGLIVEGVLLSVALLAPTLGVALTLAVVFAGEPVSFFGIGGCALPTVGVRTVSARGRRNGRTWCRRGNGSRSSRGLRWVR
jgi:hypothetical protein